MSEIDDFSRFLNQKNVNPKIIVDHDDYETKAIISKNDMVLYAVSFAIRNSNDEINEQGEFINSASKLLREQLLILSRSVKGAALDKYVASANSRLRAEDMKTNIKIEGEQ